MPRYYANNLVAGGPLQQKSNGAFFKNTRGALRKLDRARRTATQHARPVREGPLHAREPAPGEAGDPDSKAKNFVEVELP